MATDANEPCLAPVAVSNVDSVASSSDSDSDSGDAPEQSVEWLATGRAKRSTAGNRMKSMLATETPADEDSDLELLFAEDADDIGFTDKEDDDGSDAAMESSDDEDENEAQDDDAGEKELERQAKAKKAADRKRKANEAIPAKFRKKVRIQNPDASNASTAATPLPRPKKKSERASWLPTEAEKPTRASGRKTTQLSKEQLHQQMIEREARRLKQVELMERQAKKKEAAKKPPMTQAERLREAAIVEKRNAKSLNRWEEAEKQREEERRAKLAALNNRRLEGPVVTFWTGIIDLSEVQLKHVGKMVTMEEKPKRKRPSVAAGKESAPATESKTENDPSGTTQVTPTTQSAQVLTSIPEPTGEQKASNVRSTSATPADTSTSAISSFVPAPSAPSSTANASSFPATHAPGHPHMPLQPSSSPSFRPITPGVTHDAKMSATFAATSHAPASAPSTLASSIASPIVQTESQSSKPVPLALRPDIGPRFMPPPNPHFARPAETTALAPPPGISNGQVPALGNYATTPIPRATNLGDPVPGPAPLLLPLNSAHTHTPSISTSPTNPNTLAGFPTPYHAPVQQVSPMHTTASFQPILSTAPPVNSAKKQHIDQAVPKKSNAKPSAVRKPAAPLEPPAPEPPMEGKVTRACIILQDFDEDAIKKPDVQTQILFGWKMNRLAKPPHPPLCVITNQVARHRDPKTGLPYHNVYAFKEIQKLTEGNFRWSNLLGAWVGNASDVAKGVPDRFTRPETEEERHKRQERLERKEQDEKLAREQSKANAEAAETAKAYELKTEEPAFVSVPDANGVALNSASMPASASLEVPVPVLASSNMVSNMLGGGSAVMSSADGNTTMLSSASAAMGGQPGPD